MRITPPGYSGVHYAMVGGNVPQYSVRCDVQGKAMLIDANVFGVTVKTRPCEFLALIEFHAPPHARAEGLQDPRCWEAGFVQAMTGGEVVYEYASERMLVRAAVAPRHLPCADGDGSGPFLDNTVLGVRQFGVADNPNAPAPEELRSFLGSDSVKHLWASDGPGTGQGMARDLDLPCVQGADLRAVPGKTYHLGWTDPLDPHVAPGVAALRSIRGHYAFKTWLAMRFTPTGDMFMLHEFEWLARFDVAVQANAQRAWPAGRSGAELLREGAVGAKAAGPIYGGPTANDSVCVRFLAPH
ncbi:MAG: hypothetical protein U5L05_16795 [Rubrivivax sp.]|nr:hypothetical protein [Rubrivivax sp.]